MPNFAPLTKEMTNPLKIFKIKKEEWPIVVVSLLIFVVLNYLLINSHWEAYTKGGGGGFWSLFTNRFMMSGYDCWTWLTVSYARIHFETIRHPLYLTFLYPMYLLNSWLMPMTKVNWAVFIIAAVLVVSAVYTVVFLYRTLREVVGLQRQDATLLVALFFSFGHVLIPTMVPDHFCISMMLLSMTMYIAGRKMQKGIEFKAWQSMLLVFFTSGIAASNGAKTMLAALFTNGRRVFRPKYILIGFVLPLAALIAIQRYQYYTYEVPQKAVIAKIEDKNKNKISKDKHERLLKHSQWAKDHDMKRAGDGLLGYFDFASPRIPALVENYFGEGFQFYQQHALEDTFKFRPNIVPYSHWWNYAIEAVLVALMLVAVWTARRERLMQLLLSWWAFDFTLNIILGFGINEPYIMTSGWAMAVPVAIGFMLKKRWKRPTECLVLMLTAYLWIWNVSILVNFLSNQPSVLIR